MMSKNNETKIDFKEKPIEDNVGVKFNKNEELSVAPIVAPENLKSNQIFIEDYGVLTIKPTYLKYFIPEGKSLSMYNNVLMIKEMGYNTVLSSYSDGKEVIENALKAIFDTDKIDFFDKLTSKNLLDIIDIANDVNEVKIDDFLLMDKMEKVKEEESGKTKTSKKA